MQIDNEDFTFDRWREFVTPQGADVVATMADGQAALTRKGRAYYLAGAPDNALLARLIGKLVKEAGIATDDLPKGLRTRRRGPYRFAFNYGPDAVDVSAVLGKDLLLGEAVLQVGGYAVAREAR